ncbi:hypothetical protein [Streptomyces sp. NPDC056105]|uniref:hypothetical protein n=1 Tax=Streptomyces sp. NPDC056105 TaxID=3345714 RepID=UPI0035DE11C0
MDLGVIGRAAGLFAVTNIDDILILALFFAQGAGHHGSTCCIVLGRWIAAVSRAGFTATDLANALERIKRLAARGRRLESRLSSQLAMPAGPNTGLGVPVDIGQIQRRIALLEQEVAAKQSEVDKKSEELGVARAANWELAWALNYRL